MVAGGEGTDCCSGDGAGRVASEVPAAGIHTRFRWRRQLCKRTQIPAAFNPVAIAPEAGTVSPPSPESAGVIEIEFATGGRMRITGPVDVPVRGAMWPLPRPVTC